VSASSEGNKYKSDRRNGHHPTSVSAGSERGKKNGGKIIGVMGIIHPQCLQVHKKKIGVMGIIHPQSVPAGSERKNKLKLSV